MMEIPEDVMMVAREAYILVLPPASQWIADDVRDGVADISSEIQTAAHAIMDERERIAAEVANIYDIDDEAVAMRDYIVRLIRGETKRKSGE